MGDKGRCAIIYLDFAKAFDSVCHNKLMFKLRELKIHPLLVNRIDEFVTGTVVEKDHDPPRIT